MLLPVRFSGSGADSVYDVPATLVLPDTSTLLWCFPLEFAAAAIDADFGPSRLSPNVPAAYLKAWARSRCVPAAFTIVVLFGFSHEEPAFSTFLI